MRRGDPSSRTNGAHRFHPENEKLRELVLLTCEWCQADPKFGAIKLKNISNFRTARRLKLVTERMIKRGEFAWQELPYFGRTQKKPIALRAGDASKFSGPEVAPIQQTVEKFRKMNATEISDPSQIFPGWKAAHMKETISYAAALVSRRAPTDHERKRGLRLQAFAEKHLRAHG